MLETVVEPACLALGTQQRSLAFADLDLDLDLDHAAAVDAYHAAMTATNPSSNRTQCRLTRLIS